MSGFKSGEIVRNTVPVIGTVVEYRPQDHPTEPTVGEGKSGPTPDMEINSEVEIKAGQKGTVMYSDETTTIVTYEFNTAGELEPHLVKAESFTNDFQRVVRGERPSRGPSFYPDRNPPKTDPTKKSKWEVVK